MKEKLKHGEEPQVELDMLLAENNDNDNSAVGDQSDAAPSEDDK